MISRDGLAAQPQAIKLKRHEAKSLALSSRWALVRPDRRPHVLSSRHSMRRRMASIEPRHPEVDDEIRHLFEESERQSAPRRSPHLARNPGVLKALSLPASLARRVHDRPVLPRVCGENRRAQRLPLLTQRALCRGPACGSDGSEDCRHQRRELRPAERAGAGRHPVRREARRGSPEGRRRAVDGDAQPLLGGRDHRAGRAHRSYSGFGRSRMSGWIPPIAGLALIG